MSATWVAQRQLLRWYADNHRMLPWRLAPGAGLTDAYAQVLAELMLQQTRVDTVIDYFNRWLARWPDWQTLAAAPLDEVLAQWTGLGYYNRARNLHKTAHIVTTELGGVLPADPTVLARLPGIGPYTAGAVLSIAFGQPVALVDGNVARVLSRWYALRHDPMTGVGKTQVWQWAHEQLATEGPAHADPASWNQALMELGATLCSPKTPDCQRCPVAQHCLAYAQGVQHTIPPPRQRTTVVDVQAHYLVVRARAQDQPMVGDGAQDLVLLGRRPDRGRWAGLWEPLGAEGPDAAALLALWARDRGVTHLQPLPALVHILSHRRYLVASQSGFWAGQPENLALPDVSNLAYVGCRWQSVAAALGQTSGLSRLGQRLLQSLVGPQLLL